MCSSFNEEKINFLFLSNRKPFDTRVAWTSLTSSLLINANRPTNSHIQIHSHTHMNTHRLADISQPLWLWVFISFIFILQFHHSLASCTLLPRSYSLFSFFSSLIVFHHLSVALLFCFSFKLIAFISVSFSFISTFFSLAPSLSLRLAVFIFQSFISTNVRQCFCPPSIDPQRVKEAGRENRGEKVESQWLGMKQKDG